MPPKTSLALLFALLLLLAGACSNTAATQNPTVAAGDSDSLSSSSAQSVNTPVSPPGWKVVENSERGVTLSLPEKWQLTDQGRNDECGFYFIAEDLVLSGGHGGAVRIISTGQWKGKQSDFAKEMLKPITINPTMTNAELIQDIEMPAGSGFEIRFEIIAPKGFEEFEDMYWVFVGDQTILIDMACSPTFRAEYEPVFAKIAQSFIVTDTKLAMKPCASNILSK